MTPKRRLRSVTRHSGPQHRVAPKQSPFSTTGKYLVGALLAGASLGVASVVVQPESASSMASNTRAIAASFGMIRAHDPQPGAYYRNCDAARAAGVAPLYIGEPGYREGMDADGDGVACEPYRGR